MTCVIIVPLFWHIDQARINTLLASNKYASRASWHRLDRERFPNGMILRNMVKTGGVRIASLASASIHVVPAYARSNVTQSNAGLTSRSPSSSLQAGEDVIVNKPEIPTSLPSSWDPAAVVAAHANWTPNLQAKIALLKEAKVWCLE